MTEVAWFVDKANRSLAAARRLYEGGFHDFCVSRAYYAMFYMASAALLTRGLRFRRHGALVAGFGHHLAYAGILPASLHESLAEAFELRIRSDYRALEDIQADVAAEILHQAEEFLAVVRTFLEKESQR